MAETATVKGKKTSDSFNQVVGWSICGGTIFIVIVGIALGGCRSPRPSAKAGPAQSYAAPVETTAYPKKLEIPINRNAPSRTIVVEASEEVNWVFYEKVPFIVLVNGKVRKQAPGSKLSLDDGHRYELAFMVDHTLTKNDPSASGTVYCTITHR